MALPPKVESVCNFLATKLGWSNHRTPSAGGGGVVLKKDRLWPNFPFLGFRQSAEFSSVKSSDVTLQVLLLTRVISLSWVVSDAGDRTEAIGISLLA
jgi:hypothetical protein